LRIGASAQMIEPRVLHRITERTMEKILNMMVRCLLFGEWLGGRGNAARKCGRFSAL
jgi:hypothetical protein